MIPKEPTQHATRRRRDGNKIELYTATERIRRLYNRYCDAVKRSNRTKYNSSQQIKTFEEFKDDLLKGDYRLLIKIANNNDYKKQKQTTDME